MTLEERVESMERQLDMLRLQMAADAAHRMMDRFHAFDAIKNDACPACGGRVRVVETGREVTLEAVA